MTSKARAVDRAKASKSRRTRLYEFGQLAKSDPMKAYQDAKQKGQDIRASMGTKYTAAKTKFTDYQAKIGAITGKQAKAKEMAKDTLKKGKEIGKKMKDSKLGQALGTTGKFAKMESMDAMKAVWDKGGKQLADVMTLGKAREDDPDGIKQQFKKKFGKLNGKKLGEFVKVGAAAFGKLMIWFIVIATGLFLVSMIVRKAWPIIKDIVVAINDQFGVFSIFFEAIKGVLVGLFDMLKYAFKGDFAGFMKALVFGVIGNLVVAILSGIASLATLLFAILVGLWGGLLQAVYSMVSDIFGGLWRWISSGFGLFGGKATGGSAQGWTLVGEKGPELINAGRASHVYSNQQSKQMLGGNTNNFTIQVQGSMGSSDEEIRRLADKLGREINMRVNRSSSSGMGYAI